MADLKKKILLIHIKSYLQRVYMLILQLEMNTLLMHHFSQPNIHIKQEQV